MYRTIQIGAHVLAQGIFIRHLHDGRIEIDTGHGHRIAGRPVSAGTPDLTTVFVTRDQEATEIASDFGGLHLHRARSLTGSRAPVCRGRGTSGTTPR
jgi:hypothetical protein